MKKTLIGIGAIICMGIVYFVLQNTNTKEQVAVQSYYKNIAYGIQGERVQLVQGAAETPAAPNSASKISTRYFGNEIWKDMNGDGVEDVAFILTQTMGGSGTFFYVVAALKTTDGYLGSEALFLGDRIAPQTTESGPGNSFVVTYADRAVGESFDVPPSVGKSIRLILDPNTLQFGEVVQNFEGEADPSVMSLNMKTWEWVETTYGDGTQVQPHEGKKFTLSFFTNGSVGIGTDCNSGGGAYSADDTRVSFTDIISTLMYCEGAQEADFLEMLGKVTKYSFTGKGEMLFELGDTNGTARFK